MTTDVRVLVIEDDEELAETVAAGLREARMAVDVALDGSSGLARPRAGSSTPINWSSTLRRTAGARRRARSS